MIMIERVARAIADDVYSGLSAEQREEGDWEAHASTARAALTALLEPSDDMIEAGRDATRDGAYYSDVLDAFHGAIQAALDEKEG